MDTNVSIPTRGSLLLQAGGYAFQLWLEPQPFQSPLGEACFYRARVQIELKWRVELFQSPLGEACFYRGGGGSDPRHPPPAVSIPTRGSLLLQDVSPSRWIRDGEGFNPHSGKPAFTGIRGDLSPSGGQVRFQSPLGEACFYRSQEKQIGMVMKAMVSIPTRGSLLLQAEDDRGSKIGRHLSFNPHSGKPAFTGHRSTCPRKGVGRGKFQSPLGEACFYRAQPLAIEQGGSYLFQSPLGEACFYRCPLKSPLST